MEPTTGGSTRAPSEAQGKSRRRRGVAAERVRYFLPKTGSSSERPELREEAASEAEAMIEAFRT